LAFNQEEIARIDGRARFLDVLFEMIGNSKKEIIMAMQYWGSKWGDKRLFDEVIFPKLQENLKTAIKNGAEVRIMGDPTQDFFGASKSFEELGIKVKGLEGIQFRLLVVDNRECLFAISEPYTESSHVYHAIKTNNKVLVQFFKDNFESLWAVSHNL
jgi:sugar-specific transcriptional regulator TrmB